MLTALAMIAIAQESPQEAQGSVNASLLVQKMIEYYNDAATMTGTIVMTTKVGDESGSISTTMQFESPSRIYIRQQKSTGDKRVWLIVSDGKKFAYDSPGVAAWEDPGKRLLEPVVYPNLVFKVRDIYAATAKSLGDRSTPLDIAIGRTDDLKYLRAQWKTVSYKGKSTHLGQEVNVVMGEWRPYGEGDTQGQYRMLITPGGELKEFARSETVRPPGSNQTLNVVTTWTVNLKKDGRPDPNLWATVR